MIDRSRRSRLSSRRRARRPARRCGRRSTSSSSGGRRRRPARAAAAGPAWRTCCRPASSAPARAGERDRAGQVHDLHQRVGRRLQPDHACLGPDAPLPAPRGPSMSTKIDGDPPVGEELARGAREAVVGVVRQAPRASPAAASAGAPRPPPSPEAKTSAASPPSSGRQGLLELRLRGVGLTDVGVPAQRDAFGVARERGRQVDRRRHRARGRIGPGPAWTASVSNFIGNRLRDRNDSPPWPVPSVRFRPWAAPLPVGSKIS